MDYELSGHARDVMAEREIKTEWLEAVLQSPERREPDSDDVDLAHLLAKISGHGNRILRVVVNQTVAPIRVVPLYFDRTMKNKL